MDDNIKWELVRSNGRIFKLGEVRNELYCVKGLKTMTIEEIKNQLIELIDDRKSFITGDKENDEIYIKDIEALQCALRAVELSEKKTAHWDINCDGYYPYCSNCGNEPPAGKMTAYCPSCGAEMVTRE